MITRTIKLVRGMALVEVRCNAKFGCIALRPDGNGGSAGDTIEEAVDALQAAMRQ